MGAREASNKHTRLCRYLHELGGAYIFAIVPSQDVFGFLLTRTYVNIDLAKNEVLARPQAIPVQVQSASPPQIGSRNASTQTTLELAKDHSCSASIQR